MKRSKQTILCVDYSDDNAELIRYFLNESGYQVETCVTGGEALSLTEKTPYSLVMTEYRLPDMSGVEFCRQFRRSNSNTPLIFFSASVQAWEQAAGLSSGAQAYLIKPNDLNKIADTVNLLIEENDSFPALSR